MQARINGKHHCTQAWQGGAHTAGASKDVEWKGVQLHSAMRRVRRLSSAETYD